MDSANGCKIIVNYTVFVMNHDKLRIYAGAGDGARENYILTRKCWVSVNTRSNYNLYIGRSLESNDSRKAFRNTAGINKPKISQRC